jgi:hypothetical protein
LKGKERMNDRKANKEGQARKKKGGTSIIA